MDVMDLIREKSAREPRLIRIKRDCGFWPTAGSVLEDYYGGELRVITLPDGCGGATGWYWITPGSVLYIASGEAEALT